MIAYYNEFDPKAAAWLRELIAAGHIAPGEVDERDIRDVTPNELRSFRQVHLFAGIGGWSAALRKAGWSDDRPAWTVSCPCQPFSAAGQRGGFADERHLWPAAYHLISQCEPDVVLGEQSSSKDGLTWFDLVSADMEAADYSGGAIDLCSAGFGAPNIRQRNFFVWLANALRDGAKSAAGDGQGQEAAQGGRDRSLAGRQAAAGNDRTSRGMADSHGAGLSQREGDGHLQRETLGSSSGQAAVGGSHLGGLGHSGCAGSSQLGRGRQQSAGPAAPGVACRLAYSDGGDAGTEGLQRGREHGQRAQDASDSRGGFPGATNGFWRAADWVLCRDDDGPAWRPVKPSSFPLAASIPGRVALLRGAGNAINLEVAAGFIEAVMEVCALPERLAA